MSVKRKFYVVWEGREPGIYDNWDDCFEQIDGFPGARYKSFTSQEAATIAYRDDDSQSVALWSNLAKREAQIVDYTLIPEIRIDAWAVDGACAGVPGPMEYRGVRVADGAELFRIGPYAGGTNNIAEYLAIIHAAALLMRANDSTTPIYSDSKTALSWIRRGRSNSTIAATAENAQLRAVLARADAWLATHRIPNPIIKWETEKWGEIPADFGRK
jgi:ribonuclease HI